LAGIYLNLGRKELVPGEVEKALQANPHDPAIHLWLPMYHLANGDYQQAIQQTKQIVKRWPLFSPARLYYCEALREHGDAPGAIRELERIPEWAPSNPGTVGELARAYMDTGDLRKARQTLERMDAQYRQLPPSRMTWALQLALEGKRTEALGEINEQVVAYAGAWYTGALQAAEVYAVVGDTTKALEWLDRAVRSGDEREDWFRRDPHLASIREQPRFQQILESVAYRRKQRPYARPENP
jgi:tetratricopeptide (TPR) repeat protein